MRWLNKKSDGAIEIFDDIQSISKRAGGLSLMESQVVPALDSEDARTMLQAQKAELAAAAHTARRLADENACLRADLAARMADIERIKEQKAAADAALFQELESARHEVLEAHQQRDDLAQDLAALRDEAHAVRREERRRELEQTRADRDALRQQLSDVTARLAASHDDVASLRQVLADMEADVREERRMSAATLIQTEERCEGLRGKWVEAQAACQRAEQDKVELRQQLQTTKATLHSAEGTLEQYKGMMDQVLAELQGAREDVSSSKVVMKEMEAKLESESSRVQELEEQAHEQELARAETYKRLSTEVTDLQAQVHQLQQQLDKGQLLVMSSSDAKREVDALKASLATAKSNLATMTATLDEWKVSARGLSEKVRELQLELIHNEAECTHFYERRHARRVNLVYIFSKFGYGIVGLDADFDRKDVGPDAISAAKKKIAFALRGMRTQSNEMPLKVEAAIQRALLDFSDHVLQNRLEGDDELYWVKGSSSFTTLMSRSRPNSSSTYRGPY